MTSNTTIRKRIVTILALVYVISLLVIVASGYYILRQDTIREAEEKTEIFAAVMSSSQRYLAGTLRPKVRELLPDTYFPEATVGILMLSETARLVQENYPEYIFKIASPNPLNPDNLSNAFEDKIISEFENGDIEEWRGFVKHKGKEFYTVATPMEAGANCIWCHDTPDVAHPQMVKKYGTRSGYGYTVGDIVGARFVYIPTETAHKQAIQKLIYFSGGFSLIFLLALIAVDRIINNSVVKPIENMIQVASDISRGKMDSEFEEVSTKEIQSLADAFKRMKVSLGKAMNILRE